MKAPLQFLVAIFALCTATSAQDSPKHKKERREAGKAVAVVKKTAARLKAEKIIFPKIEFRESTIHTAFDYLTLKAKQLDSDGRGINIIYKPDESKRGKGAAPADRLKLASRELAITLQLENIPLSEVLKYIANLAGLSLRWDEHAVFVGVDAETPEAGARAAEKPNKVATWARAEKMLVPKLDFRESTVRDALDFLALKSRQLDPDGKGVNFIMMLDEPKGQKLLAHAKAATPGNAPPAPAPAPAPGIPDIDAVPAPAAPPLTMAPRITFTLENVPLSEAVRYIAELGGLGARWDEHAIFIWKLAAEPAAQQRVAQAKPTRPRPKVKNNGEKGGEKILARYAKQPITPKVDFRETSVRSAVEFLVLKHKQLDSEGMGMNLELKLDDAGEGTPIINSLTLSATDIPMFEVLRYIAELSGLDVSLDANAIFITPPASLNER